MTDHLLPQVVVAQLGARRHYLVPATFHAHGMLARFETDFFLTGKFATIIDSIGRLAPVGPLRRMSGRQDVELPASIVHSFPWLALRSQWRRRELRKQGNLTAHWLWVGRHFGQCVARRGFDRADAVYGYSSASLELFEAAKSAGKFCILDQATAPKRFEDALTMRQAERYPGWSQSPPVQDRYVDEYADRQNQEAVLADLVICGSTFVKNAVQSESGQGDKCEIVPLGLRRLPEHVEHKSSREGRRLRILFVGDEAIRKGIGDLYVAVRNFGVDQCDARVAGNLDLSDLGRAEIGDALKLLGPVPRTRMDDQYRWADVCVLPSLSDTFGLVILEALSHGVPVITTPNTGGADVISEGENGFIVPIMSPETIADRLRELHEDPALLESMSIAARNRCQNFGLDGYAKRLINAVRTSYESSLGQNATIAPESANSAC